MSKEKSLGQILGEKVLESLSKEEKAKVITVTLPPLNPEIAIYLDNLKRFEEASRKVNIIVREDCHGYCQRARELQQKISPSYSA